MSGDWEVPTGRQSTCGLGGSLECLASGGTGSLSRNMMETLGSGSRQCSVSRVSVC